MTSRGVRAAMGDWGASRSTLARWARALGSCSVGPDETPRGEESAQQATQAQSTGSKARSDDGPGAGRWTFRSPGRRSVLPASECGNARRSAPACQPAARWAADGVLGDLRVQFAWIVTRLRHKLPRGHGIGPRGATPRAAPAGPASPCFEWYSAASDRRARAGRRHPRWNTSVHRDGRPQFGQARRTAPVRESGRGPSRRTDPARGRAGPAVRNGSEPP
jgi:hypothetical protein